uniref:SFRICE_038050 n=1 Tax=Spodoptera frugiperda TaxID=7108 RepID=A0A2H1WE28_SPOFR
MLVNALIIQEKILVWGNILKNNHVFLPDRELTTTRRPARGKLRNMHQRHLGSTIMTHCAKDGVCISSSACDWDHIVQDDKGCLNEHKDFVCCSAASVQIQSNVFTGYDWL